MKWMQSEDKRKNQQRAGEWQEERDGERERETHWEGEDVDKKMPAGHHFFSVSTDSAYVCVININTHKKNLMGLMVFLYRSLYKII